METFSSIILVVASVSFWIASCASLDCVGVVRCPSGRGRHAASFGTQRAAAKKKKEGRKEGGAERETKSGFSSL